MNMPTWNWLVAREPRLHTLATDIMAFVPSTTMPNYWRDWTPFKHRLDALVGWDCHHTDPAMRRHEARDAAFDHLWRLYCDAAEFNIGFSRREIA